MPPSDTAPIIKVSALVNLNALSRLFKSGIFLFIPSSIKPASSSSKVESTTHEILNLLLYLTRP